jgi:hypothetical protein
VWDPPINSVKWCGVSPEIEDQEIERLRAATASTAFELKQSLCGIVTNANACLRMLGADPPKLDPARETLQRVLRDSNRALAAVTRFETLTGTQSATQDPVDSSES